jgi:hypothetical protein
MYLRRLTRSDDHDRRLADRTLKARTLGARRRTTGTLRYTPGALSLTQLAWLDFARGTLSYFACDATLTHHGLRLPHRPGALHRLATDSEASPPSLSRHFSPTSPRTRGLHLPRRPGALHRLATDSEASPPSLPGHSSSTSPRTRGLRLPRRPGALHRPCHGLGGLTPLAAWVLLADTR